MKNAALGWRPVQVQSLIVEELVYMWERKRGEAGSCGDFLLVYIIWDKTWQFFVSTCAQGDQPKYACVALRPVGKNESKTWVTCHLREQQGTLLNWKSWNKLRICHRCAWCTHGECADLWAACRSDLVRLLILRCVLTLTKHCKKKLRTKYWAFLNIQLEKWMLTASYFRFWESVGFQFLFFWWNDCFSNGEK